MCITLLLLIFSHHICAVEEPEPINIKQALIPHKDHVKEEPHVNSALTTLQSGPSAVVAGCVHAISGDYFESETDLVIPGPVPFKVQRTYCSSGEGWQFSHMPFVRAGIPQDKQHIRAIYQDDSGAGFEYYGSKEFKLRSKTIERLTNCGGGEISGRTNWKNARLTCGDKNNERYYLFTKGSGTRLVFERYKRTGEKGPHGYPQGKYQLHQIRTPHNNHLWYHYDKDDQLVKIQAVDSSATHLITATLSQIPYITQWHAGQSTATYHFKDSDKEKISIANASQKIPCSYEYDHKRITKKTWLKGRYLQIEYYPRLFGKGNHRVSALIAPVGSDGEPCETHRFSYYEGKEENHTAVVDANGGRTLYISKDRDKRLHKIIRFHKDIPYTTESFYWGSNNSPDAANLISRACAAQDHNLFCQTHSYDPNGNVIEEKLWGNLTGNNSKPLVLNNKGIPKENGCEVYSKRFTYSEDGYNLLLSEEDEHTWTQYHYNENHLLDLKIIGAEDRILKREFFAYDAAGTLIEEIFDDGIRKAPDNLEGVTERHRKTIVPTQTVPKGLPHIITEEYLDGDHYQLLKKTVNTYSPTGKLITQENYGSDGQIAFILHWEYNHLGQITKETNALKEEVSYTYDELGNKFSEERATHKKFYSYDLGNRLIAEKEVWNDGTAFTITHTYDALGHKTSSTDIFGCMTWFTYDTLGRLFETLYSKVPFQEGMDHPLEKIQYNDLDQPVLFTDKNGNTTTKEYTIRGQPYRIVYPDGSVETKEYSLDGWLVKETAKNGTTTYYHHDPFGRVIYTEKRDDADQFLTSTSAHYNSFHLKSETDPNGITTYYEYDPAGHKIATIREDKKTTYQYDNLGRLIKETQGSTSKCERFDALNRVIEKWIQDEDSGTIFERETCSYDSNGNRITVNKNGAITRTTYNPHNEPVTIKDPLGNITRFDYFIKPCGGPQNQLTIVKTDPLGNQEHKVYDSNARLQACVYFDPFGQRLHQELFRYDLKGNRQLAEIWVYHSDKFSHPFYVYSEYDTMDRLIKSVEAAATPEEKTTRYHYHLSGEKSVTIKPDGVELHYQYDALNRLLQLSSSDDTIRYSYSYDHNGNLLSVSDDIHQCSTQRKYDPHNRLIEELLDNGHLIKYFYDHLNRVTRLTLPDSSMVQYTYDAHYLKKVSRQQAGNTLYTHRYDAYDPLGNVIEATSPVGKISYQYDLIDRLVHVAAPHWQEHVPPTGYDAAGNLLQRTQAVNLVTKSHHYQYDNLYQLISETSTHVDPLVYQYDSIGNRLSKNHAIYQVNIRNQLLHQTDKSYSYDPIGNLIKMQSASDKVTYQYDALDRLIAIEKPDGRYEYHYDPFHRRTCKKTPDKTIHYLYQGENEIGASVNGVFTELRILGLGIAAEIGASIAIELNGVPYFPIHDILGNIVILLDKDGKIADSYDYTTYGEPRPSSSITTQNPWRYCSKRFDPETSWSYFGQRYYDPSVGRWTTPDPAGYVDGFNLYAYVHNNPLSYLDSDGEFAFLISFAASYAISAALTAVEAYVPAAIGAILGETALAAGVTSFTVNTIRCYNNPSEVMSAGGGDYFGTAGAALGACLNLKNVGKQLVNYGWSYVGTAAVNAGVQQTGKLVANATKASVRTTIAPVQKVAQAATKVQSIEASFLRSKMPSLDSLSKAGQVMDRGGLTKAGRALDKHGNRIGSPFPKAVGNSIMKNKQGQFHLDDILTNPKSEIIRDVETGNYKIYAPDGRGAYFNKDSTFRGFIESIYE